MCLKKSKLNFSNTNKFILTTIVLWVNVLLFCWAMVFIVYGNHEKYDPALVISLQFWIFLFLSIISFIYICKLVLQDLVKEAVIADLERRSLEIQKR